MDYSGGIEFKADGTFFLTANSYAAVRGKLIQKGNYSVQGDRIICTNVTESWTEQGGYQGRNYTDKAISDLSWSFYFSPSAENEVLEGFYPGLTWLVINVLSDSDLLDWYTISTVE